MNRIALFATAAALALSIASPSWAQAPAVSKATADVEAAWQHDVADLSANAVDLRARLTMDKPGTSDYARDQLDAAKADLQQKDAQASAEAVRRFVAEQQAKVSEATKPLQNRVEELGKANAALTQQVAALTKQKDDLSTEVANAKSLGFVWHPGSPPSAQSHPMSTPAPGGR
jgi:FtsZ-binding cell division protein ZapB